MNIWSHLIGAICTVLAFTVFVCNLNMSDTGLLAVTVFSFCALVCLSLSATYHWFGCMSSWHQNCLLCVDLSGVAVLTSGSVFSWFVQGFSFA